MKFAEVVNIAELRALCESFTLATGAVTAILDLEGNILIATGWQDICSLFHRAHPSTAQRCRESDTILAGGIQQGQKYNIYQCKNCLNDVAVPIHIRGEHVANFFTGQFFTEPPDREFFRQQARQFGFEETAYLAALDKVPIFACEKIQAMANFFTRLAQLIGEIGLARKELLEINHKLQAHQEHLEDLVTERTSQLQAAKEEAETANRAKSVFLASMSHELRTPLNAVLGFSRLMNQDSEATPAQKQRLNIINQSGEHLLHLINNVLDISKIEAGRVEVVNHEFDLPHLLEEQRSVFGARAAEKGLAFQLELTPDLPQGLECDLGKLRQILINLLGNAVKYTNTGHIVLRAAIALPADNSMGRLRIEVEDSGPGIAPEDCSRIFLPFVQLANRPASETGSGLGLAICKQYVELLGGQLHLESHLGKGSRFFFEFPARFLACDSLRADAPRLRVIGLASNSPVPRILIAEDQKENRWLLEQTLQPLGLEIRESNNGTEAVAIFSQWPADLIWMDIRMPVLDGLEATKRIRAMPGGRRVKIIALTAHAMEQEQKEILAAGCDDLVRKPYRETDLFDAMARHLELRYKYANESPDAMGGEAIKPTPMVPEPLARQLHQAVVELDTHRVHELTAVLAAYDSSTGSSLAELAQQLDYTRLLARLETCFPQLASSPIGDAHESNRNKA